MFMSLDYGLVEQLKTPAPNIPLATASVAIWAKADLQERLGQYGYRLHLQLKKYGL